MVDQGTFHNAILNRLDTPTIKRLHLRPVELACGHKLVVHGEDASSVLFLESGIASVTVIFRDGFQIEAGLIGSESMIGIESLLGSRHKPHGTFMRLAGAGFWCPIDEARREFSRYEAFHDLVLDCMQASQAQAFQLAGCNSRHEVSQKIPRWLLMCSDRLGIADIRITHEMICNALGVTRPTVTTALDKLQDSGSIDCGRGRIRILDFSALRAHACECYPLMSIHNPENIWETSRRPFAFGSLAAETPMKSMVA